MKDASEYKDGREDLPVFIHSALDDYGLSPVEFRVCSARVGLAMGVSVMASLSG